MRKRVLSVTPEVPTERQEQIKFVNWIKNGGVKLSASANGGSRNLLEGANLKKMGVSAGFPDIEIPLPIKACNCCQCEHNYHGLYIEMKRQKGGRVSPLQEEWLQYLNDVGYYAKVAKGFEEAKQIFLDYLAFANSGKRSEIVVD